MVSGQRGMPRSPQQEPEPTYQLHVATVEDCDRIYESIGNSLARPRGKTPRRNYVEAAKRNELLILERHDPREDRWLLEGMLEWYTRVDGVVTIKDAGTKGEEPDPAVVKRLVRELIQIQSPVEVRAKTKDDQTAWLRIFHDLPGFRLEGREYSRPHWVYLWSWAPSNRGRSNIPLSALEQRHS
ncbi:MAG: hypothetical protein M1296_04635 [Chloroflexi bacterium]|nr:hypothetical protein [Chloroflexota bacterium]